MAKPTHTNGRPPAMREAALRRFETGKRRPKELMQLIAFDIDGTLTRTAEAFDGLFAQALEETLGISMHQRWSAYQYSTDSGILTEAVEHALGRSPTADEEQRAKTRYFSLLEPVAQRAKATPGAQAALDAVAAKPGVQGCFVTGNWRRAAQLKLAGAQLEGHGFPIFSADDSPERSAILQKALEAHGALGPESPVDVVYLGDAPWDATAASGAGVRFVGVVQARDRFAQRDHLEKLRDFADLERFWRAVNRAQVP